MNVLTLLKFFGGNKQAILDIAGAKHVLWLGMLFVLSAGFAREYDGEDLRRAPWHLLIPLAASLVSSLVLYSLIWQVATVRGGRNSFPGGYRQFLALFWMTAPLAWLYAIPVERLLTAVDSVRANLWLLGLVSLWRVLLITRVVSVVYRCKFVAAFCIVMLFADAIALVVLSFTPLPIISIMGGIRLTEAEAVLLDTALFIRVSGVLSLPVWIIAGLVVLCSKSVPDVWRLRPDWKFDKSVSFSLWALSGLAILIWAPILPYTQSEQANRTHAERLLRAGQISAALAFMSERERSDFPPHWDPPPRIGYGEREPDIFRVLNLADRERAASWVRSLYVEKVLLQSHAHAFSPNRLIDLGKMDEADLAAYVELLGKSRRGSQVAAAHQYEIDDLLGPTGIGEEQGKLDAGAVGDENPGDVEPASESTLSENRKRLLIELRAIGARHRDRESSEQDP